MPEPVLIIDDDVRLVAVMKLRLEASGFGVDVAYNGEDGLAAAARRRPKVILLDVNMPVMDGFEVCRALRADPNLRDTPVILISAVTHERARDNAMNAGANLFLAKPYQAQQVIAALRNAIAEQAAAGEMQPARRTVS